MDRRTFTKTITVGTLGLLYGCSVRNRFDIIIKNGHIIDGTSTQGFFGDIGIIGDKIAAIDDLKNATAGTIINGEGLVVSPGFIDIHTHTDLELFVNSNAESKILQGVTTEVSGNCGSSLFPLNDADFEEADTNTLERYGFHVDWRDIKGFLRRLEDQKASINYATFTGHGQLRSSVVGRNDVQATTQQVEEMKQLLARSMGNGSFGLSSGLEYAPGSYASTDELIELNKVVAQNAGVYATHIRDEEAGVEQAIEEALMICRETGVSLQISHLKAANPANWDKIDRILEGIHSASDTGFPVHADRYPYIAFSTGLSLFLPLWMRQGRTADIIARLGNSTHIPEIDEYLELQESNIGGWDRVVISFCNLEKNKRWIGRSVENCARELNVSPSEFIRTILIEEKNNVPMVGYGMSEPNLKKVLSSPLVMIGSDGNALAPQGKLGEGLPHPRSYGTFPRVLGRYTRDEQLFDRPIAIKKMTSMPATKLGIPERGVIAKDYYADIVVFNPQTVMDNATFEDPHQFPTGIEYVIVNGQVTVENGRHTGAQAGAVLRHQPA